MIGACYSLDILRQAVESLRDNRLRTLLSILGITFGIAAVMAVGSVSKGGHHLIFSELETFGLKSVWVYRKDDSKNPNKSVRQGTGIDNNDLVALQGGCCDAVELFTPIVQRRDRFVIRNENNYSNAQLQGGNSDYFEISNDHLQQGRIFRPDEVRKRRKLAVIGPEARNDLFGKNVNAVGRTFRIADERFTVVGTLKGKSRDFLASIGSAGGQDANNRMVIPYTVMQQLIGENEVSYLYIQATTVEQANKAAGQVKTMLDRRHHHSFTYQSETMAQYIHTSDRIMNGVSLIGVIAASVSLLVGGMGIMNIMSTAVLERTREIGLRKAVGARNRDILFQFLMEAVFISVVGGVLGLAFGWAASWILALATGFPLTPSWLNIVIALAVSIGVGLASGYYPARRAAGMKPVEALRYE
jgi:putative ABC transport system permease protein